MWDSRPRLFRAESRATPRHRPFGSQTWTEKTAERRGWSSVKGLAEANGKGAALSRTPQARLVISIAPSVTNDRDCPHILPLALVGNADCRRFIATIATEHQWVRFVFRLWPEFPPQQPAHLAIGFGW